MNEFDFEDMRCRLRSAANQQTGDVPNGELRAVLSDLAEISRQRSTQVDELVLELLPEITSATGAGFLCVWLGAKVESGLTEANATVQGVAESFILHAQAVPVQETRGLTATTEEEETLLGLELIGRSFVSHWRQIDDNQRATIETGNLGGVVQRIASNSVGAGWVQQVISQEDGHLIAVLVEAKRAYRLRYQNVSNCFHLFTLLQDVLRHEAPSGAQVNDLAISAAKGEKLPPCSDTALWHYSQPVATKSGVEDSVWGEKAPSQIFKVDDTRVLVLWPAILEKRIWDSAFFDPYLEQLPPSVVLKEQLSADETDQWWERLNLPNQTGELNGI